MDNDQWWPHLWKAAVETDLRFVGKPSADAVIHKEKQRATKASKTETLGDT